MSYATRLERTRATTIASEQLFSNHNKTQKKIEAKPLVRCLIEDRYIICHCLLFLFFFFLKRQINVIIIIIIIIIDTKIWVRFIKKKKKLKYYWRISWVCLIKLHFHPFLLRNTQIHHALILTFLLFFQHYLLILDLITILPLRFSLIFVKVSCSS